MAGRVHDLDREAAHAQHVAVARADVRRRARRLLAQGLHAAADFLLLPHLLEVLRRLRAGVEQELLLVAVQHDFRPGVGLEVRRAARVIEVVVREHDVAEPQPRPAAQELAPRRHGLLVPEAAVDERGFVPVLH